MENSVKVILVILAIVVGLLVLSSVLGVVLNLFNFLDENYIAVLVVVAAISGLILLSADKVESPSLRTTGGFIFVLALLNLVGVLIGSFIERGIGSFFK
jgi:small-conductance mechanosensitive channel